MEGMIKSKELFIEREVIQEDGWKPVTTNRKPNEKWNTWGKTFEEQMNIKNIYPRKIRGNQSVRISTFNWFEQIYRKNTKERTSK